MTPNVKWAQHRAFLGLARQMLRIGGGHDRLWSSLIKLQRNGVWCHHSDVSVKVSDTWRVDVALRLENKWIVLLFHAAKARLTTLADATLCGSQLCYFARVWLRKRKK